MAQVAKFISGATQIVGGLLVGCLPYLLAWLWFNFGQDGSAPATKSEFIIGFFSTVLVTFALCLTFQGITTLMLLRWELKLAALGVWLVYTPLILMLIF